MKAAAPSGDAACRACAGRQPSCACCRRCAAVHAGLPGRRLQPCPGVGGAPRREPTGGAGCSRARPAGAPSAPGCTGGLCGHPLVPDCAGVCRRRRACGRRALSHASSCGAVAACANGSKPGKRRAAGGDEWRGVGHEARREWARPPAPRAGRSRGRIMLRAALHARREIGPERLLAARRQQPGRRRRRCRWGRRRRPQRARPAQGQRAQPPAAA